MPTLQKQKSPVAKAKKKTAKSAAKGGKKVTTKNNEVGIKREEINLICTHCNKTFTTEAGLLYHMGKMFLVCLCFWYDVMMCTLPHNLCVYSPFSIHIYTSTYYTEKKVCQKTKDDKEFPCPHCNKVFTTEKRLSNHIGKPLLCLFVNVCLIS